MFILAAVALIAEALVTALENRLIRWRPNMVTDVSIRARLRTRNARSNIPT